MRSRGSASYFLGMHNNEAGVAAKICAVQGEQVGDTANIHRRHQSGVVHRNPRYGMGDDQASPFLMDRWRIGKGHTKAFD